MLFESVTTMQDGRAATTQSVPGSYRRAWTQVLAAGAALSVLAARLPSPRATLETLSGSRSAAAGSGVADTAMLAVAAVAVWLLLAWVVLISTVAVAGRLPGAIGAAARSALLAVAPVAVRNVLMTVVGASVVTGLAGCASVGAGTAPGALTAAAGTSSTAPSTAALSTATRDAAVPAPMSAATPDADAPSSGSVSQLAAQRLVGIATLRISDRIAVEGSAVRSAGAAPAGTTPGVPGLDWPASVAKPVGPVPAAPDPTGARSTPPTVGVDWPGATARGARPPDTSVVVLRGDSLWSIAARSLPAGADDTTIDRTWRAWYAANTSVIGSDPDHLLPGQILTPPTTGTVAP